FFLSVYDLHLELHSFPTRRSSDLDRRISIKKEMLQPYNTFESQVKDIVSIVKQADNVVRSQVKEIEERDREAKRQELEALFNKRSEEHTSELQSRFDLVCRLLLEK